MMFVNNDNSGVVNIKPGKNPRILYEHQVEAQRNLNVIDKKESFSTLLVLPTGAGKTLTSVHWILKNAIDKRKKVLWIAHRHLLLEQASEAFQTNAYRDVLINRSSFKFRVISGKHDRVIHIDGDEDLIIASKDSLIRNLEGLDEWAKDEEIYLVIDEAHHATAKSYRQIIEYLNENANVLKILGLTATPFRTDEKEKGLLGKVFYDDIIYEIGLNKLINKGLLSRPNFEECKTDINIGESIGLQALQSIEKFDNIPKDIAEQIASNGFRNKVIVEQYKRHKEKYGKTIVFALNRVHAVALKQSFDLAGIKSEFIISGNTSDFIGIDITDIKMEESIKKYKNDEIDVLINVNILTEGVDLPETKTIFLTRPTISKTLMTQMIGRGLRGERAGGTKEANIVTFIDDWNDNIAWVNPKTIIVEEEVEFEDKEYDERETKIRYISISKIEEFARILDETIDTRELEELDFIERIPVGMYIFNYLYKEQDINHQILIYNTTKQYYDQLIEDLEIIFKHYRIETEYIHDEILEKMIKYILENYFDTYTIPSINEEDIGSLLRYYAQKGISPQYHLLEEVDRKRLDISRIAEYIYENNIGERDKHEYILKLWNDESTLLKVFFNKITYFINQLEIEISKLSGLFDLTYEGNILYEQRNYKKLSLYEIGKYNKEKEKEIRDNVFESNKNKNNGIYKCEYCGKESKDRSPYHIDHIKPLSKGGLTVEENLQILCRSCNLKKSDNYGF